MYKLKQAKELRDQKLNAEQRKAKSGPLSFAHVFVVPLNDVTDLEAREMQAKRGRYEEQDAQKKLQMQVNTPFLR